MTKYKWDSPNAWLHDQIADIPIGVLGLFISAIDPDLIQNFFQDEMADDGYFKLECPQCGEMDEGTQIEDHGVCRQCQLDNQEEEEE